MRRCIDLASRAASFASPNPYVGSVLVHEGRIIGEGFNKGSGEDHAEVEAVNSVVQRARHLLIDATLYVNLEPCAHHGKTPPCSTMIADLKIPRVVIGAVDTNPLVNGKGLNELRAAGVDVVTGVIHNECRALNRRFFTYYEKDRPYVVLKWAQSTDCYIAPYPLVRKQLSGTAGRILAHKWRAEEDAILVGYKTALVDDPLLDVRLWHGRSPMRCVYDPKLELPRTLNLFRDDGRRVVLFNTVEDGEQGSVVLKRVNAAHWITDALAYLHSVKCLSVYVEGGARILSDFIAAKAWDEARVFTAPLLLHDGRSAPVISHPQRIETTRVGADTLTVYWNNA